MERLLASVTRRKTKAVGDIGVEQLWTPCLHYCDEYAGVLVKADITCRKPRTEHSAVQDLEKFHSICGQVFPCVENLGNFDEYATWARFDRYQSPVR